MTKTTDEKYTFTFKLLKHGINVEWQRGMDEGKLKFSLVMWEALSHASLATDATGTKRRRVAAGVYSTTLFALEKLDVFKPTAFKVKRWMGELINSTDHYALSEFGLALHQALPKCPPREKWPTPKSKEPPSVDNIRLTKTQRDMLTLMSTGGKQKQKHQHQYRHQWASGYRLDDPDKKLEDRWTLVGDHPFTPRFLKPLLDMDLIEVGVSLGSWSLVVRPTVHGALHAEG